VFVDVPRVNPVGDPSAGPGARYLRARAAARMPVELAALRASVASLVKDERAEAHDAAPLVASVYHLVHRADRGRYATALDRAILALHASGAARVVASGPWPPYAFTEVT
jgi:hypothetical protein